MTTLNELEQLAKAAKETHTNGASIENFENYFYECSPQTILRLISLVREMGEALEGVEHYTAPDGVCQAALARYKEFGK